MLETRIAACLIRGSSPVLDARIAAAEPEDLCISAITRGELLCGVSPSLEITRQRIRGAQAPGPLGRVLDEFFARVACLVWNEAAATQFAVVAVQLHRAGTPLGTTDAMIAGHALAVGAVLVTDHEHQFARVTGLQLEDWTRKH